MGGLNLTGAARVAPAGATGSRVPAILLAVIAMVVYANSLAGERVFDDDPVLEAAFVRPTFWPIMESWFFNRRAIVELSWNLNHAILGKDAVGFHIVNIAIHAAATVTLFLLARLLLASARLPENVRNYAPGLAFAISLLWCVHPLNTESVTFIVQRYESMASMFMLLALLFTARGASIHEAALQSTDTPETSPLKQSWRWFLAAAVMAAMATLSKEISAGLAVIALLMDRTFTGGSFRRVIRQRGWFYLLLLAMPLLYLTTGVGLADVTSTEISKTGGAGFHATPHTWLQYLFAQGGAILHYFRLTLWPYPLCLDYYDWHPAPRLMDDFPKAAVIGMLVLATFWALWKRPAIGFVGACFFIILGPSSSVIPVRDIVSEHRMYAPLIAVIALLTLGGWQLMLRFTGKDEASRRSAAFGAMGIVGLLAIVLASLTVLRSGDYADSVVLWAKAAEVRPNNPRAYRNMAAIIIERKQDPDYRLQALNLLAKSTELAPDDLEGELSFAKLALEVGRLDLAIDRYNKLLIKRPGDAPILLRRGNAYLNAGALEQALESLTAATAADPKLAEAHASLGLALLLAGKQADAVASFRRAVEVLPNHATLLVNLARALAMGETKADRDEAAAIFERLTQKSPENAAAWAGWGGLLVDAGELDTGLARLETALRLQPNDPETKRRVAWAIAVNEQTASAQATRALQLAREADAATGSNLPASLDTVAAAYARLGLFDDAVRYAKRALDAAKQFDQKSLIQPITDRLALYESRRPFSVKK